MTLGGLVLFVLAAGLARPQSSPGIEIHGVVTEVGASLGLTGAEVTLYEFVRDEDRYRVVVATGATDTRGEFHFHPMRFGAYYVEVKKQGYVATSSFDGPGGPLPEITGTLINVSAEHPSQEVRLALMRPGELTGQVIDEDGKPLAHMAVQVAPVGPGRLAWQIAGVTDQDGTLVAKKLIPGEYLVKISSEPGDRAGVTAQFADDDLKIVDQESETVYWPGVPDERSANPARVSPGASANLGTLRVRKTPSYRVRVSIAGCQPDDRLSFVIRTTGGDPVMLLSDNIPSIPAYSVTSCEDLLVRGLKPGAYKFSLTGLKRWASAPVEITNRNLEVQLTMSPEVDASGRFVVGEGVTLPSFEKVRIMGSFFASPPDAKGAFRLNGVRGATVRILVAQLGSGYYVKEIRVDGRVAPDDVVALRQGSQLEIEIDDKPATIAGSVTDGDKPFSQPLIFVAKWPSVQVVASKIIGDNDGRFRVTGLAPGEYRVLAVQSVALPDGQQIWDGMLSKLWGTAEKVKLERGGSQSVALSLSNPMR